MYRKFTKNHYLHFHTGKIFYLKIYIRNQYPIVPKLIFKSSISHGRNEVISKCAIFFFQIKSN
jgi:hypothetical protein